MMIYRAEDKNSDYILGQGNSEWLSGSEAVAQAIVTSLKLLLGEWWEDVNNGLPLWQSILGQPGSEVNKLSVDNIIRERILETNLNGTPLVSSIDDYAGTYNANTRAYSFTAIVTTIYSESVTIKETLTIG